VNHAKNLRDHSPPSKENIMPKRFLTWLLILFFCCCSTACRKVEIAGTVLYQESGLPGVRVTLNDDPNLQCLTDQTGAYRFSDLRPGHYSVTPSFEGLQFEPPTRSIQIYGGTTSGVDFAATVSAGWTVLFVAVTGNDSWSGTLPAPSGSDGPLATIGQAQTRLRELKAGGDLPGPATIFIRKGTYPLAQPLLFEPADSGSPETPIHYRNYPGETPILSGGQVITGWTVQDGLWQAHLPEVESGAWSFGALWANGERRPVATIPNDGYLATAGTAEPRNRAFRFQPGDILPWGNLNDVVVEVFHSWSTSLHRIQTIDLDNSIVTFTGPAVWDFELWGSQQRYRIHNVAEGLDQPGEWYLDRPSGILSYIPRPGEDPAQVEVVAPKISQLLRLVGNWSAGQFVTDISFQGLNFLYTDWQPGPAGASSGQAAIELNGAIEVIGGRSISVSDCTIAHVGTYGLWLREGTQNSEVTRCHIHDLGGGGVRLGMDWDATDSNGQSQANRVENCFIHDGGKILSAAVGVWIGRNSYNQVLHNEICDLDYTGVSVGWSWGYAPSSAHHNIIADNHIHHIGRSVLSDMGAVYTLGISPGTEVRHNLVHDIFSYGYGGWGLYTDEGSSEILIKDNLVYNTKSGGFHQHYGENNEVTNNILAFAHEGQIRRSRLEDHNSFNFHHNIVIFNNGWLLDGNWQDGNFNNYQNIYWDIYRHSVQFGCTSLAEWQAAGHDAGSLVTDPLFEDAWGLNFELTRNSPAPDLGFIPFDLSSFGLYGDSNWTELPGLIAREPSNLPEPVVPVLAWSDDFESSPVGSRAAGAITYGETTAASIRVSAEIALSGQHSLKFQDAPDLDYSWNPHMYYQPRISAGMVTGSFALNLGEGAIFYHEWRDSQSPYSAGPSISINAAGQLVASGQYLTDVPRNTWLSFTITYEVGLAGNGLYDLTLTRAGQGTQSFQNLGQPGQTICGLHWWGFVANSNAVTSLYLDDMALVPE
jgi:hypothetical protein